MKEVRGEVTSIHEKDFHGTMLYSFKLDDKPQFWRCGKDKPDVTVKDYIQFQAKLQNVIPGTIQVVERNIHLESAADAVKKKLEEVEGEMVKKYDVTRVTKDPEVGDRIRYQQARRDATSLVVAALHTDALPWTATQVRNKSRKLDLLTGYIEQVTETLLEQENDNA